MVEYITTFGNADNDSDDERQDDRARFLPQSALGRPAPSVTASKLAASVVSSMFKDSPKTAAPSASSESFRPRAGPSSSSAVR